MKNFMDLLIDAINRVDNPTVMGLDPNLDFVPEHIVKIGRASCRERV